MADVPDNAPEREYLIQISEILMFFLILWQQWSQDISVLLY